MDSFKNKLLIILCVFVVITPFWLVKGFCAETEDVEISIIDNLIISYDSNPWHFVTSSNGKTGYFVIEPGYIYTVLQDSYPTSAVAYGFTDTIPTVDTQLLDGYGRLGYNQFISFNSNDYKYLYFDYSWANSPVTISRVRNDEMENSVSGLVDNVGIDNIWNIFDISIDYIVIAVAIAFGLFIIFKLIQKFTKGKEGF